MTARFLPSPESIDVVAESTNVIQRSRREKTINLGEVTKG